MAKESAPMTSYAGEKKPMKKGSKKPMGKKKPTKKPMKPIAGGY
jgi:hypothetical protein